MVSFPRYTMIFIILTTFWPLPARMQEGVPGLAATIPV